MQIRLTNAKTSVFLRLNAFFSENGVNCAKTCYFALKTRFWHIIGFNAMKALGTCKRIELCKIRLTSAKTSVSLRLRAFFSKNDVKCPKMRYFALKTRFMHIINFNAMKALGNMQTQLIMQIRLTNAKTSVFLRLNAFFSENEVNCAKTCYFALKTRFWHIIGFIAMKALGNVQKH